MMFFYKGFITMKGQRLLIDIKIYMQERKIFFHMELRANIFTKQSCSQQNRFTRE
jgi:hypothetical protein